MGLNRRVLLMGAGLVLRGQDLEADLAAARDAAAKGTAWEREKADAKLRIAGVWAIRRRRRS